MYDSDDEDVIFEGSPLHDTLVSRGSLVQELKLEVLDRDGTHRVQSEYQPTPVRTYKTGLIPRSVLFRWRVVEFYLRLLAWLGVMTKGDMVKRKDVEIVTTLLQSSTLDEDDTDFLYSYLEIPQVPAEPGPAKSVAVCFLLLMMPVVCACGFSTVSRFGTDMRFIPLTMSVTALTLATLPLVILYWVHYYSCVGCKKQLCTEMAVVKQYIKADEDFLTVLRRSLRLIQEAELIARGFTLVSQKSPISRLEASSSLSTGIRQCPGLRKLVFTVARGGIYSIRELTKQLLTLKSSSLVSDINSTYLAFEPVQSYGPCLQLEHDDTSIELYNITDGFSVSALKGICHLLQLHQSEFIKALALSYSHNFKHPGSDSAKVLELLVPSSKRLQAWTCTVQESYNLHSCSLLSQKPTKMIKKPASEAEEVYTAIHSLDLHLQSALTRVRTFSSWLEARVTDSEDNDSGFNCDDLVNSIMQPIRAELDSCKSCWDEGVTRIEKMLGKYKPDGSALGDSGKLDTIEDPQDPAMGHAKKMEDYIIEDQVFEGYTDPSDMYNDAGDWDRPLTVEEKEKKKREKEEALRMLTELKSVISIRAVDWEKRERAALLRAHPEIVLTKLTVLPGKPANLTCPLIGVAGQPSGVAEKGDGPGQNNGLNNTRDNNSNNAEASNHDTDKIGDRTDGNAEIDSEAGSKDGNVTERKPMSYVTSQGIRRLRKSNMLDQSDSDSDISDECTEGKTVASIEDELAEEREDKETNIGKDNQRCGLLGLPLFNAKTQEVCGAESDSNNEGTVEDTEDCAGKPTLTLEERLRQFSRANMDMSSTIAAQAVARSRLMGGLTEATFGGEVFGECSSSEEDSIG